MPDELPPVWPEVYDFLREVLDLTTAEEIEAAQRIQAVLDEFVERDS